MNMSQPLFRQFKRGGDHQQIAYALQLKCELKAWKKSLNNIL
jgi:hypothetical protein